MFFTARNFVMTCHDKNVICDGKKNYLMTWRVIPRYINVEPCISMS
jgi:hypothetical protein